jgi:FKBP-type peptidyl-prolyl cis-trans isomerase FkpA
MKKENGVSGAKEPLIAILLHACISTAAVILMQQGANGMRVWMKTFKCSGKPLQIIKSNYNPFNKTKMKTIQSFLLLLVTALVLASCGDGAFKKTKSGLLYKIVPGKKGQKLKAGNYIKFNVKVYQKDSLTYDSYGKIPAFSMVDSVGRNYDISEVFPLMSDGDSAIIIQSADSIAKMQMGQMPPGLKKGDKVKFMVRIVKTYTDLMTAQTDFNNEMSLQKEREFKTIEAFLKTKNINAVKTALGTYVETITPGTGALADSGKQVSVKYTGMNFDGKKFDSNVDTSFGHVDPYKIVIGQMGSIPGFEDGIKQVAKGGKAKIYIPSMLAYGMQGSPPSIKAYENLIFEIEVLDITDAPKGNAGAFPPQAPATGGGN